MLAVKQGDDSMRFYLNGMDTIYARLSRALIKKTQEDIKNKFLIFSLDKNNLT